MSAAIFCTPGYRDDCVAGTLFEPMFSSRIY
jgi:hypothetical protein